MGFIVFAVVMIVIIYFLKLPVTKGMIGESVSNLLLKFLNKENYTLHKDLYISKEDGDTAQIDHVVVSRFGIFVIETKNYQGWIFGNENSYKWTQVIYRKKSQFLNPVIQNRNHIKALKQFIDLGLQDNEFFSIIVFSTRCRFKRLDVSTPVIYSLELPFEIKKHQNIVLTEIQVMEINKKIDSLGKASINDKIQHIEDIKTRIHSRTLTCPRCGGSMIERSGKYGVFYGCSGFPKCKFTINNNDHN